MKLPALKFAVIDVETTGLNAAYDRVIEIGLVLIENYEVVSKSSFFVNPGKKIPGVITALTGISTSMVNDSKPFDELADEIDELTNGCIFVGHNVAFDYAFLKKEMQLAGIPFTRKVLCTARLARFLFPGLNSYSLKKLSARFDIQNERPHRALPDAVATASLLLKLISLAGTEVFVAILKKELSSNVPSKIKEKLFKDLPQVTGVYYFIGKKNKPLYIGKAKNIDSRVRSHFRGDGNSLKLVAATDRIKEIRYEVTGDELLASLLEDHEIRHYWPEFNNGQKVYNKKFGVVFYKDMLDRWRMAVSSTVKPHCFLIFFHRYHAAVEYVSQLVKQYNLNGNLCGYPGKYTIDNDSHNKAFADMYDEFKSRIKIELFLTKGRKNSETGFVWIERGVYKGFGYTNNIRSATPEILRESLQLKYSSVTTEKVISEIRKRREPDMLFYTSKKASTEISVEAFFQT